MSVHGDVGHAEAVEFATVRHVADEWEDLDLLAVGVLGQVLVEPGESTPLVVDRGGEEASQRVIEPAFLTQPLSSQERAIGETCRDEWVEQQLLDALVGRAGVWVVRSSWALLAAVLLQQLLAAAWPLPGTDADVVVASRRSGRYRPGDGH